MRCDKCKEIDPKTVEIEPGHLVKCCLFTGDLDEKEAQT